MKSTILMLNHSLILVNLCYNTQKPAFIISANDLPSLPYLQIHNSLKAGDIYKCIYLLSLHNFLFSQCTNIYPLAIISQLAAHLKHSSESDLVPSGENGTKRNL